MNISPKYTDTKLSHYARKAAQHMGVMLPDPNKSLALLYWDHVGVCRAFVLTDDNLHYACDNLSGIYKHRSEIVPL